MAKKLNAESVAPQVQTDQIQQKSDHNPDKVYEHAFGAIERLEKRADERLGVIVRFIGVTLIFSSLVISAVALAASFLGNRSISDIEARAKEMLATTKTDAEAQIDDLLKSTTLQVEEYLSSDELANATIRAAHRATRIGYLLLAQRVLFDALERGRDVEWRLLPTSLSVTLHDALSSEFSGEKDLAISVLATMAMGENNIDRIPQDAGESSVQYSRSLERLRDAVVKMLNEHQPMHGESGRSVVLASMAAPSAQTAEALAERLGTGIPDTNARVLAVYALASFGDSRRAEHEIEAVWQVRQNLTKSQRLVVLHAAAKMNARLVPRDTLFERMWMNKQSNPDDMKVPSIRESSYGRMLAQCLQDSADLMLAWRTVAALPEDFTGAVAFATMLVDAPGFALTLQNFQSGPSLRLPGKVLPSGILSAFSDGEDSTIWESEAWMCVPLGHAVAWSLRSADATERQRLIKDVVGPLCEYANHPLQRPVLVRENHTHWVRLDSLPRAGLGATEVNTHRLTGDRDRIISLTLSDLTGDPDVPWSQFGRRHKLVVVGETDGGALHCLVPRNFEQLNKAGYIAKRLDGTSTEYILTPIPRVSWWWGDAVSIEVDRIHWPSIEWSQDTPWELPRRRLTLRDISDRLR